MSEWGAKLTGFEVRGSCWLCGSETKLRTVKGQWKEPRTFCSTDCRDTYMGLFRWRTAATLALHRAHFKCEKCGMSERGMSLMLQARGLYYRAGLEVHHKVPLLGGEYDWSILNLPENLQVLCADCHDETKRKVLAVETAMADRVQLLLPF